jgi:glutamine amidotransferase
MIAIVNYGMGNLRSVQKALEHLGATTHITSDPADLHTADASCCQGWARSARRCNASTTQG